MGQGKGGGEGGVKRLGTTVYIWLEGPDRRKIQRTPSKARFGQEIGERKGFEMSQPISGTSDALDSGVCCYWSPPFRRKPLAWSSENLVALSPRWLARIGAKC